MRRVAKKRCERVGSRKGFTIIEIMVTLGIIGVLASLAFTNYYARLPRIRASDGARQIWADLHLARSTASKEKVDVVVSFDVVHNTYSVIRDVGNDMSSSTPPPSNDVVIARKNLPVGIQFVSGVAIFGIRGEALGDGVVLKNNRVFFQFTGHATINNDDTMSALPLDLYRSIYIMHERTGLGAKNDVWQQTIFGVYIEPISGLPKVYHYDYTAEKWGR